MKNSFRSKNIEPNGKKNQDGHYQVIFLWNQKTKWIHDNVVSQYISTYIYQPKNQKMRPRDKAVLKWYRNLQLEAIVNNTPY